MPNAPLRQARRFVLAGYFGFGNVGDEAILSGVIRDVRDYAPAARITVLSGDPGSTAAAYGVDAVLWTDVGSILSEIARADAIIIGGGGIFHDYWGVDPRTLLTRSHTGVVYYCEIGALARLFRVPLIIWSVGIGPLLFRDGEELVRDVLIEADVLTVRDAASIDEARRIGVMRDIPVVADAALRHPIGVARREGRTIVVSVRSWDKLTDGGVHAIATALDEASRRLQCEIVFAALQVAEGSLEDDMAAADRVIRSLPEPQRARVVAATSPDTYLELAAEAHVVVAMRLHALVLAARLGVPGIALSYDPKVDAWMQSIDRSADVFGVEDLEKTALADEIVHAAADDYEDVRVGLERRSAAGAADFARLLDALRPEPRTSLLEKTGSRVVAQLTAAFQRDSEVALPEGDVTALVGELSEGQTDGRSDAMKRAVGNLQFLQNVVRELRQGEDFLRRSLDAKEEAAAFFRDANAKLEAALRSRDGDIAYLKQRLEDEIELRPFIGLPGIPDHVAVSLVRHLRKLASNAITFVVVSGGEDARVSRALEIAATGNEMLKFHTDTLDPELVRKRLQERPSAAVVLPLITSYFQLTKIERSLAEILPGDTTLLLTHGHAPGVRVFVDEVGDRGKYRERGRRSDFTVLDRLDSGSPIQ
jgi:polysaccharide pyruvyl transferase CsaB